MKKVITIFFSAAIGIGLMFTNDPNLFAQETDEEFTLEEITVTAQKREEDQQKVPIAMEVISGEKLAEEAKTNVDEILANISNVLINTMPDGMRVSIRGLVDQGGIIDGGTKTSSPSVAVNVDGAFNNMATAGQNLFDVERVEVLMGPQSTLYSSNAPGGIVNIVTAAPKTDRYSANGSVEYGSFHTRNIQTAFNAPVFEDKLALRLAASDSKRNTWVNGSQGSQNWATRLKTMWKATDDLSMTLTGNLSRSSSGGMMGGVLSPL